MVGRIPEEDRYGLTTPWPYSQVSLTSLDFHPLNSPAPEVTLSLFRRVQKLKQLKSLYFALYHLRELASLVNDSESAAVVMVVVGGGGHLDEDLCFPSIQRLRIANRGRTRAYRRRSSM